MGPSIDKSKWGPGPWQEEPDRLEFEHLGFPCIVLRTEHGHLCGYVAVAPGHPWHGKKGRDIDANVHGGLTYAEKCQGEVCHVPKPGEPDGVWWLGFDHAHYGDVSPGREALLNGLNISWPGGWGIGGESYKDIDYVRRGCESLAEQASKAVPQ